MTCNKCGTKNAPLKKCCSSCGAFLEGRAINNVTGEVGYRNAAGSFTPDSAKNTETDHIRYDTKKGEHMRNL